MFEQKSMPIFGAMMPESFIWPPIFRCFIGREIRNFTKSFLVYSHPPIVRSTDLMNPLTNLTSLLSEISNSCRTSPTNSSQTIQIKRQKKQCFNCPMRSLKALVTKKKKRVIYIAWETEFRMPFTLPETNMNVSSWHSSQFWLVSLWRYFTYCNFILYAFLSIPALNKFMHIGKHKIARKISELLKKQPFFFD